MSKITKGNLVILAVLLALCNMESRAADKQEADAQTKVENPYNGARVLVEVLIVEVKPEALEKAGVGPLSKERATAAKILDIIKDKNAGRIQSCEKLALVSPGAAHMEVSGRKEIPLSKDANGNVTSWSQYDIGSNIKADLKIEPDGRIFVGFRMDIRIMNPDSRTENQRPEVLSYSWDSRVSMKSGIPVIASALENKDKVTYLILRANIEEDSLPQSFQHKK
jgi:predicted ribonuclease toxin of YeeF-YezG toxin-antitoxin module